MVSEAPLMAVSAAAAGMLQLAQEPTQGIDFMLVGQFLPLSLFDQFENTFHLVQRLFQGLNDISHIVDGLTDRRGFWRRGG